MAIAGGWAGRIYGTNTGNTWVKLEGSDDALSGELRVNEGGALIYTYSIKGEFDGNQLTLSGEADFAPEGVELGSLTASAKLDGNGNLDGEWETTIGSAGSFVLFPHNQLPEGASGMPTPDQLHTARHRFGAIEINKRQIVELGHEIARSLPDAKIVVTVITRTEQSRFLEDFEALKFQSHLAEAIKIVAQEPDIGNINKVIVVEMGPSFNEVMTQAVNEAWALGTLELLKRRLGQFESSYATNLKRLGLNFNQFLLLGTLVYLPSLPNLLNRVGLTAGVLGLIVATNWFHTRYLPNAVIYLQEKRTGLIAKIGPSFLSWVVSVSAGVAAILLAGYLAGWLNM